MKKIMFGAMALISLSVAASAALTSSIPGITVTESSCDDGYIITSTREGVSKTVEYDSCLSDGIVVKDVGHVSLDGLTTVNINGVDVHFPAGYTTPTGDADDTCTGGYNTTINPVYCGNINLGTISNGYLNLTSVSGGFFLDSNQLTNVDGLANLTSVGSNLYLSKNQLTNVDGLANLTSVGGTLALYNNQLTNVDGLANLTSVGDILYLSYNQLTNVNGLANLTSVEGILSLNNNQLTNVDGLANLMSVGGYLVLDSNPNLQDLSGLNNLESIGINGIRLDVKDYAVKLDANSYICQNFATKVKLSSGSPYPTKSDICNP